MVNEATNIATETNSVTTTTSSTEITKVNVSIASDGTISIDGKTATNSDLSNYYNNLTGTQKEIVKGVFNNNRVTIDGITYVTELNEKGELVSPDGKTTLSQSKVIEALGNEGYEALVTKSVKTVNYDSNGKVTLVDKENTTNFNINEVNTSSNESNNANNSVNNSTNNSSNSNSNQTQENASTTSSNESSGISGSSTSSSTGGASSGYSGGSSSSSTGGTSSGYSGSSTSSSSGSSTSSSSGSSTSSSSSTQESNPYGFNTSIGNNSIIMVEFEQLGAIRDELKKLQTQINEVGDDYTSTISGLAGNDSAWSGLDKDAYISQKQGYTTNMTDLHSTLGEFVSYLDECLTNYKTLESELAAKTIS